jgi:hypothetical protein
MSKLLFQCICPKTNLIDPQGKVVLFVGQVFRKCPLSGKPEEWPMSHKLSWVVAACMSRGGKALSIIAACTLFLLGGATASRADVFTAWTLSNVTFADGGTASGSFVVDNSVFAVSAVNITTTTTATFQGTTYTDSANADLVANNFGDTLLVALNASHTQELVLYFKDLSLFIPTETMIVTSPPPPFVSDENIPPSFSPFRLVTGGSAVPAVPLPTALPLFASGLVGLLLLGWRRKRKAAAV